MKNISVITKCTGLFLRFDARILFKGELVHDVHTKADICRVTDCNIRDVCAYEGNRYLKKYKKFLSKGDIGYYAYLNGKWAHRMWLTTRPGVINRGLIFPPFRLMRREAYSHFCETAPEARGFNIAAAVLHRAAVDLKDSVDCFYALIDENNHASCRAIQKAGFKQIKKMRRIGILWFDFYREMK